MTTDIHENFPLKQEIEEINFKGEEVSSNNQDEMIEPERNIFLNLIGDGNKLAFSTINKVKNYLSSNSKTLFNLNNEDTIHTKIRKREEHLFHFTTEEEIECNEIFIPLSKKKEKILNSKIKKIERKLRERFYYRNRNILFNLFNLPDDIDVNKLRELQELHEIRKKNPNIIDLQSEEMADSELSNVCENEVQEVINLTEEENQFSRIDKEYQKKFGRLYRTFDVRFLKNKILESLTQFELNNEEKSNQKKITFQQLVKSVSQKLTKDNKNNISSQSCFVCVLHIANEKSTHIFFNF